MSSKSFASLCFGLAKVAAGLGVVGVPAAVITSSSSEATVTQTFTLVFLVLVSAFGLWLAASATGHVVALLDKMSAD